MLRFIFSIWTWFCGSCVTLSFLFVLPHLVECGILVPQPGIEPMSLVLEAQRLNHWTMNEVPIISYTGQYF